MLYGASSWVKMVPTNLKIGSMGQNRLKWVKIGQNRDKMGQIGLKMGQNRVKIGQNRSK